MASVEDILIARAMKDKEDQMSAGQAASLGAGVGALGGITAGQLPHMLGKLLSGKQSVLRPGARMAGGLAGAIAGGALGAGVQMLANHESPAARIVAKVQSGQPITREDQYVIENILADTYSNM